MHPTEEVQSLAPLTPMALCKAISLPLIVAEKVLRTAYVVVYKLIKLGLFGIRYGLKNGVDGVPVTPHRVDTILEVRSIWAFLQPPVWILTTR